MEAFDILLEVAKKLNGPGGCPWDQRQTFVSLQRYVLEEAHEVVEAVDKEDREELVEELGDLLYTVVFYAKVAEREGLFTMEDVLRSVTDKLIRRHPHVFGEVSVDSEEEVIRNWENIKKEEKGKKERPSALSGIPDSLSSLMKAQKMARIFQRQEFAWEEEEEDLGGALWKLVEEAEKADLDLEGELRRALLARQKAFQCWEENRT